MLLKSGAIFIAILSILLVILEKNLPVQPALTLEELPKSVQDWEQKGKYLDVFGHKMFVIQEGQISKDHINQGYNNNQHSNMSLCIF